MKKTWFVVFAGFQLVGCILPLFANVHLNVTPLVLGVFITLPGSLLIDFIPQIRSVPGWGQYVLVVIINFVVWAAITYGIKWAVDKVEPR